MKIQQLSPGVVKKLRSGIAFTSVAHCVEELVLNSIDAGATCIAVNLNLPLFQIQVIDNGCGIDAEQMKIIGTRYATSKCHSLQDLQNLKSGGFRGEALSSLKEVSSILVIESRVASSSETYCKIFTQGKSLDPKKSLNSRPSKGTSVSVYDFMYNLPVRKKAILEALDLEECRKLLQSIALMHPNISFTLKNEVTGEMCLQLKKCTSLYHSFLQIFGKSKANNLKKIDYQKECYEITGCISTDCHISKDLQFLYVNKRHVLRTKLHKLINTILNKALSSRQKLNTGVSSLSSDSSSQPNHCQCIFALNISCPYDKYDIIFEPRKTMIEFSEWDSLLKVVQETLIDFLKKENLYSESDETEPDVLNSSPRKSPINFEVQDCRQGRFSNVVRRHLDLLNSNEDSTNDKNLRDLTMHLEDEKSDACVVSGCSVSGENAASKISYKDGNSSGTSASVLCEKNIESSCVVSAIGHNNGDEFMANLPNTCGFETGKAINSDTTDNSSPPKSEEVEFGIPCRTVFPSENPIMLRVPTKSALSDLRSSCSSSNFHKLKERIQSFARKEKTLPLVRKKLDRTCEKKSLTPSRHGSLENSPSLCFNAEKYEEKLKVLNQPSTVNKSSQCPSVSDCQKVTKDHCRNVADAQDKEKPVFKATKDVSLQCPSVCIEKPMKAKVLSRFEFKADAIAFPLRHLKKSRKPQKESPKKPHSENFFPVGENLLNSSLIDDREVSIAKKLKLSHCTVTDESDIVVYNKSEGKSMEIDIEGFSEVRANSEEHVNNFDDTFVVQNGLELFNPSPIVKQISETNQSKIAVLNCAEPSFGLQAFVKTKHGENCAQNKQTFTELESNISSKKDELAYQNDGNINATGNQFYDLQTFPLYRGPNEGDSHLKEVENEAYACFKEGIETSVAENMHVGSETSEDISLNSNVVSPSLTEVEYHAYNSDSPVNKNNFSSAQKESSVGDHDGVRECVETELIGFKFQHEVMSDASLSSPDITKADKSASDAIVSSLLAEIKLLCGINFESNPFTQSLLSAPIDLSPRVNNLQENDRSNNNVNALNSSSHELFVESSVTEPSLEESAENERNFKNPIVSGPRDIILHPCPSAGEFDGDISMIKGDVTSLGTNSCSHSKLVLKPESKRKIYDDRITENSTYVSPKEYERDQNQGIQIDGECSGEANVLKSDVADPESKSCSHWKLHLEPESKRKIYVDRVTGNSTYVLPKKCEGNQYQEAVNGALKKSHFFLTHDYSPFISKTQTPENNLKNNSCVQNDLKKFIVNIEKLDWHVKWRISQESFNYNDNRIENMLIEWENPMFDVPYEVTSVANNNVSHNVSQLYSFLNSYKFSKSTLDSLQVIGQVDCKFIACIIRDCNEKCKDQRLLTLFDQHAVHERIRLEELIEDLYETDEDGEKSVKTSVISPPLQVSFSDEEIRLLRTYHEKLHKIGIHINMDSDSHVYSIKSMPSCLVSAESNQLRRSVSDSTTILQNAAVEWLNSLVKTRSIPQVLPKTLQSVLNYQACRGAVKFGDPLTLDQCKDLLKALSGCKLPFQCAHGRPSIAPILDLKKIEGLYKKKSSPQLWTLYRKQEE